VFLASDSQSGYGGDMKKIRLSELSEQVQRFLEQVKSGGSIAVVDDNGELQCGVTPYTKANPEEKRQAMLSLEELWKKTGPAMEKAGVTEDDIMRDLLVDD